MSRSKDWEFLTIRTEVDDERNKIMPMADRMTLSFVLIGRKQCAKVFVKSW